MPLLDLNEIASFDPLPLLPDSNLFNENPGFGFRQVVIDSVTMEDIRSYHPHQAKRSGLKD